MEENKRKGKCGYVIMTICIAFMFGTMGLFNSPINFTDNVEASYPYTFEGDPYITISQGWNLISFSGDVTFTAEDLFTMERDPYYRTVWDVYGIDMVIYDEDWDGTIDANDEMISLEWDYDDWFAPNHLDVIGDDFSLSATKAYAIHSLVNCYIWSPSTLSSFYAQEVTTIGCIGIVGEDGFWSEPYTAYKHAHDLQYNLKWYGNGTQYNGDYRLWFYWNPCDGWQGLSDAPPYYSYWSSDGEYITTPSPRMFLFDHFDWHNNGTTANFHLSDPYFQDHMGLILVLPLGTHLNVKWYPDDETCGSPEYSYPD